MSLRTRQNISNDGLDDRIARFVHAQRTGDWLNYPPAEIDEHPTFLAAFEAKRRTRKMLMKSKQQIEHKKDLTT
ncbi:hypothetical protein LCGC14_0357900 [marine sediment metagenome]|uniref:Uncharacterized protein n=1 Tax=marine sediment metagenome TaxID=412755 RepID=A0A0F9T8V2_9ZZZZ